MDEENKEEIKKEEPAPTEDKPAEGSKPATTTLISQADLAAERLEKANERQAELLRQQEDLEARKALGGGSEAGQAPVEPKEETSKEYRERVEKEMSEGKHND
ncbi:hypothetical protein LCGC14_1990340 [marine sediment metagenome]|uniref:Uncharacterized protein n=1 Tax=marine sediment metagenome TaxID=412755 RepID=A0A0F9FUC7_9ZZZZ